MVIYADRVNHDVGFLDLRLDFTFGIAAVIVTAVRDDEQSLFLVLGLFHLVHAQINRVQQSGAAFGAGEDQLVLDLIHIASEVGYETRHVGEGNHEEFVLRVGGFAEFNHRFASPFDFGDHAPAHVEDNTQGDGCVLGREMPDFLALLAFEELKIIFGQAGNQAIHLVGNGYGNENKVHIFLNRRGVSLELGIDGIGRFLRSVWRRARNHVDIVGAELRKTRPSYNQNDEEKGRYGVQEFRPDSHTFTAWFGGRGHPLHLWSPFSSRPVSRQSFRHCKSLRKFAEITRE